MPVHEYKQLVEYYDVGRFIHKTLIFPPSCSVLPAIDDFQVVIAPLNDSKPKHKYKRQFVVYLYYFHFVWFIFFID